MDIYNELLDRVERGETFHIDFEKRTMKVGKDKLIDGGEYNKEKGLIKFSKINDGDGLDGILCSIEAFYANYKYSFPSERSDSKRRKYFKALPASKMTDEQLWLGAKREVTQAMLEGFILCMIVEGKLVWDEEKLGKWFWQSEHDPDLVILRSWIENKNN